MKIIHPRTRSKFLQPRPRKHAGATALRAAAACLLCLVSAAPASGQWYGKRTEPTAPKQKPAAPPPTDSPSSAPVPAPAVVPSTGPGGWSIVLELHSGPKSAEEARARLAPVSLNAGRRDVYIRPTARGAAIVVGSYAAPDAAAARADLEALRSREVEGKKPFSQAFFAPPRGTIDPGLVPELNLIAAKQIFGKDKEYTLQIAFYQSKKPEDAKRAAEKAALQLRRDGELAFYYHGKSMSLVTVGVFGDSDFDQNLRPKNAAILALQQRYPLNLHNGEFPVIEKQPGQADAQQPSQLVQIP